MSNEVIVVTVPLDSNIDLLPDKKLNTVDTEIGEVVFISEGTIEGEDYSLNSDGDIQISFKSLFRKPPNVIISPVHDTIQVNISLKEITKSNFTISMSDTIGNLNLSSGIVTTNFKICYHAFLDY